MVETVDIEGQLLKLPAIAPKLQGTPGATDWPDPEVGSSNSAVYGVLLGLGAEDPEQLRREGVI